MFPGHLHLSLFFGHWVEISGQSQNLLEVLYVHSGLGRDVEVSLLEDVQQQLEDVLQLLDVLQLEDVQQLLDVQQQLESL